MGKEKENAENSDEESTNSDEEKTDENPESDIEDQDKEVEAEKQKTEEKKEEPADKKNVEELRKVIKVDDSNKEKTNDNNEKDADLESTTRDGMEQKRAILQSIKDFDFQIKKNQEEITAINKKLDSVSKDLDDLVSLYEIVSEQMNPFVGLSKVTKKRIDALENFTKEIEDLKTRLGDIESFAERAGADIQNIRVETAEHHEENETDNIQTPPTTQKPQIDTEHHEENETDNIQTPPTTQKPQIETEKPEPVITTKVIEKTPVTIVKEDLAKDDLDIIIEKSLNAFSLDEQINITIDEFIESLLA